VLGVLVFHLGFSIHMATIVCECYLGYSLRVIRRKLIGMDSLVKLSAETSTPMTGDYSLIDTMPMCQREEIEGQ